MSAPKSKRNKDIVELLTLGFSINEVATSYNLTETSIYTIRRKSGIASNTDRTLVPIPVIAKELNISKYEVKEIIDKFLRLSRKSFEDKGIEFDDLSLEC